MSKVIPEGAQVCDSKAVDARATGAFHVFEECLGELVMGQETFHELCIVWGDFFYYLALQLVCSSCQ